MKSSYLPFLVAACALFFASCGNENTQQKTETPAQAEVAEPIADTAYVTISGDDKMLFDTKTITVHEGQTVVLTLKHIGTSPKSVMGHNFVLLDNEITLADFGQKAATAVDHDYIPQSEIAHIIAHTKMIGGGETDMIVFPAPPKGTYEFLCSFPGHYAMMKGIFSVK